MAGAVAPGLAEFQKVGEGLFETLTRLARDYQVVDVAGVDRQDARHGRRGQRRRARESDRPVRRARQSHRPDRPVRPGLPDRGRADGAGQAAVAKAMADLGLAGITTKDQFKQTVLGLDLTTEAGQQMYAQLLTIAPAFAKVQDYLAKLNPAR
jgi:hypothetical protein